MNTRIYVVKHFNGEKVSEFLVDAPSKSAAERHVAARVISAQVANGRVIAGLMSNGVKVEVAGEDTQTEQLPLEPEDAGTAG